MAGISNILEVLKFLKLIKNSELYFDKFKFVYIFI